MVHTTLKEVVIKPYESVNLSTLPMHIVSYKEQPYQLSILLKNLYSSKRESKPLRGWILRKHFHQRGNGKMIMFSITLIGFRGSQQTCQIMNVLLLKIVELFLDGKLSTALLVEALFVKKVNEKKTVYFNFTLILERHLLCEK